MYDYDLDIAKSIRSVVDAKSVLVVWHRTRSDLRLKIDRIREDDDYIYLCADPWDIAISKIKGIGQREIIDIDDCRVFLSGLNCGKVGIYQIEW